jgi:hypothetical protein
LQRAILALPSLAALYHKIKEPQPFTGHRCLYALGTTCLLLLASSLLAFRLGRSLRGAALGVLRKHKHPDYYNTKFIISSDFLIYFVCFKTSLTCGTSFQLFGGRSQTKKLLKAGCTLFLAFDENIFPHVKTVMGSYV